jgi:hypothetical protein
LPFYQNNREVQYFYAEIAYMQIMMIQGLDGAIEVLAFYAKHYRSAIFSNSALVLVV